ncbi:unnamed protein product [Mycena citricolor]|uniref:DNA damage-binding protein CMR1 n=1 Tax=Mycena citricolor TaxID=2018698 RepID=A0AAD2HM51_9AGAR|nr:unnamed protein product [Mycena citricolor]
MPSQYELERERNIARNKALLEQLQLKQAVHDLAPPTATSKSQAKPVQSSRTKKPREAPTDGPRRQSSRLRGTVVDPNETPKAKKRRLAEMEEQRALEAEERIQEQERERLAKRPRHMELDLATLAENEDAADITGLASFMQGLSQRQARVIDEDAALTDDEGDEDDAYVSELRDRLQDMKVVSRAKVTQDRIYSAAYHPEVTKDKHGQLGIWDARAPPEEVADEDGDISVDENQEGGKYWRLQLHWPATSKSSISCVKIDPIDSQNVYTSSYDKTVRSLSFISGVSKEVFSIEDALICSIDLVPGGREMWISDDSGAVWHRDLRQDKSIATRYELSEKKIGCISVNPVRPNFVLTASNSRALKIWDVRKLQRLSSQAATQTLATPAPSSPGSPFLSPVSAVTVSGDVDLDTVTEYLDSKKGKGCLRAEWRHEQSVSSAYWDARGGRIVSTSYDNTLRMWNLDAGLFHKDAPFPSSRPLGSVKHNCQTGKWLTILKAQWSPNSEVYPHFTIGNMNHSLDIFSCKGELITRLEDRKRISAVQAVTCSHPSIVERAVSGNGSGRTVLWALSDVE